MEEVVIRHGGLHRCDQVGALFEDGYLHATPPRGPLALVLFDHGGHFETVDHRSHLVTEQALRFVLPSPELVYCAQPGITPLNQLRDELDRMRAAGAVIRGVVLWSAERPVLAIRRDEARRFTFAT